MKAYDNKTALLKTVLKTVMDPPGGLKPFLRVKKNKMERHPLVISPVKMIIPTRWGFQFLHDFYRPCSLAKQGDNAIGSLGPSICLSERPLTPIPTWCIVLDCLDRQDDPF